LKEKLTSAPILKLPDWNRPFHVYRDASSVVVGSTLCQINEETGREHPIVFASQQLTQTEHNYTTMERKCLAMIFSVKKFRHYLLKNLVNKANLSGRLARWVLLLAKFDYIVGFKPGKKHLRADHLS